MLQIIYLGYVCLIFRYEMLLDTVNTWHIPYHITFDSEHVVVLHILLMIFHSLDFIVILMVKLYCP